MRCIQVVNINRDVKVTKNDLGHFRGEKVGKPEKSEKIDEYSESQKWKKKGRCRKT